MRKESAQFVITSNQPAGNVFPLMDSRVKPNKVVLLRPDEEDHLRFSKRLIDVCKSLTLENETVLLPESVDSSAIKNAISESVDRYLQQGYALSLNVTCGPKLICIIAHEVFKEKNLPVFYVKDDWLRWLNNPNDTEDFDLHDRIKIPTYFKSYGLNTTSLARGPIDLDRNELSKAWLNEDLRNEKDLGILNYYASQAKDTLSTTVSATHLNRAPFMKIVDDLIRLNIANLNSQQLTFSDETSRFFANGGWLEDHVFNILSELKLELPKLQDIARSVEVTWLTNNNEQRVRNELDVVVLYNNQCVIIECKTKRFERESARNIVYKVGSLVKYLGGIQATGGIISYHRIAPIFQKRASLMDVFVCDKSSIHRLKHHIKEHLKTLN